MAAVSWENFLKENPTPSGFTEIQAKISEFCNYHWSKSSQIVLVTSGGTTVPLELNTVRFVDNFSAGTRGSASAEYFLKAGFAVIFLYRTKSLEPYFRHISISDLMDSFETYETYEGTQGLRVTGKVCDTLVPKLKEYKDLMERKMLLKIQFESLSSYLHLLHDITQALKPMGKRAILYLAAAVSDFYIPERNMAAHKIHSETTICLNFQLVPKMLQPLVQNWVPEAFVVSFKLETDESLLVLKAKAALEKYEHSLVIANELRSRKHRVVFVTKDTEKEIVMSESNIESGKEIEELIVEELQTYYYNFKCFK